MAAYDIVIRNGQVGEPFVGGNISGNHLTLWKKLVAVGNDPYRYSAMGTPSLVFEDVALAGL